MGDLARVMSDDCWVVLLRGLAVVVFGLIALDLPGLTLPVLLTPFGVQAAFDGIPAIVTGHRHRPSPQGAGRSMAVPGARPPALRR